MIKSYAVRCSENLNHCFQFNVGCKIRRVHSDGTCNQLLHTHSIEIWLYLSISQMSIHISIDCQVYMFHLITLSNLKTDNGAICRLQQKLDLDQLKLTGNGMLTHKCPHSEFPSGSVLSLLLHKLHRVLIMQHCHSFKLNPLFQNTHSRSIVLQPMYLIHHILSLYYIRKTRIRFRSLSSRTMIPFVIH